MVIGQLVDLFGRGGLEVTTRFAAPRSPTGSVAVIRTVIQLDGDVITWIAGGEPTPEATASHQQAIAKTLNAIRQLRFWLRYGWMFLMAALLISVNAIQRDLVNLFISVVVIPAASWAIRLGLVMLLRFYLRRQIQKLTGGLLSL